MAQKTYLPPKEADRKQWLDTFDDNLPGTYATKYNITTGELTRLHEFRLWNDWTWLTLFVSMALVNVVKQQDSFPARKLQARCSLL